MGLDKLVDPKSVKRIADSVSGIMAGGEIKEAEINTRQGLRTVALIPLRVGTQVIKKYNQRLFERMADAGHALFLMQLVGYEVKVEAKKPEPERTLDAVDIELIRLSMSTINPVLVDGYLLGEVAKARPHLKEHVKEGLKLLASVSDIPEVLLTPTVIGAELGISARAVNKLLLQHGYQVKNPMKTGKRGTKSLPDYVATELGQQYAEVTLSTGIDAATYQHLKWQQSIVEVLSQYVGV
jgi:hypothetical protein